MERRAFVKHGVGAGLLAAAGGRRPSRLPESERRLEQAAEQPILRRELYPRPVPIDSIELLRCGELTVVRTRSSDGAFGVAATNSKVKQLHPILSDLVAPYFVGKDARDLEDLIAGVYLFQSNYKMSS